MIFDSVRFHQELVYRANAPVEGVLPELLRLRLLDREAEKQKSKWSWVAGLSIVFTPVAFVLGTFLTELIHPLAPFALAAAPVGLVIFAFVQHGRYNRIDLDDRRYQLLRELLRLLQADMAPDQPVDVLMDLRAIDDASKFQGKGKVRDWNVKYYQDPWLSLRGRLLDGTHFQLGMVQKLQKRSRWVQTYYLKYKYKYKSKERALAWVQLRVKPEKHPQLEQLGRQARGAVRLPPGSSIRGLDVTADSISLEVVVGHDWEAAGAGIEKENASRLFAMMLMSCYQVLNLSRSLGKKSEMRVTG